MLTGVAGAADDHRVPVEVRLLHRHVVVLRRQSHAREDFRAVRTLDGDDAVRQVAIVDRDPSGRERAQCREDGSSVGGVRDDQHLVVGPPVDDEVVDDTSGLVEQHRVLGVS